MAKRTCCLCVYAGSDPVLWVPCLAMGWGAILTCVNHADCPGKLRQVLPSGACRNFRARRERPVWTTLPEPPDDQVRYIALTKGYFAIVDAADYEWLSRYKWTALTTGGKVYAIRNDHGKTVLMHREIVKPADGLVVDHISGNGLDNRRDNVRPCNQEQNRFNSKPRAKKSPYKGVRYVEETGRWIAEITHRGRKYHLGTFDDERDAARAYDRKARDLFGPYARLNFPDEPASP